MSLTLRAVARTMISGHEDGIYMAPFSPWKDVQQSRECTVLNLV